MKVASVAALIATTPVLREGRSNTVKKGGVLTRSPFVPREYLRLRDLPLDAFAVSLSREISFINPKESYFERSFLTVLT